MRLTITVAAMLLVLFIAQVTEAQQLMVYPSQGQTPEQQVCDQAECRTWATQQTSFDPAYAPPPPVTPEPAPQGGLLRGAARGALVGVTVGAMPSGLALGTVLSLLVVPVIYSLFFSVKPSSGKGPLPTDAARSAPAAAGG